MTNYNHKPRKELNLPKILKFNHLTLKGVTVILVILSLIQLYISNNFVTDGEKIKEATSRAESLEEENSNLTNQVQQLSSLSFIEKQAKEAGFSKIEKIEYLDKTRTVATNDTFDSFAHHGE